MNQKQNALYNVQTAASLYRDDERAVERSRKRLYETIQKAREAKATQQELADATIIDGNGLSRQRIAQIIKGE